MGAQATAKQAIRQTRSHGFIVQAGPPPLAPTLRINKAYGVPGAGGAVQVSTSVCDAGNSMLLIQTLHLTVKIH